MLVKAYVIFLPAQRGQADEASPNILSMLASYGNTGAFVPGSHYLPKTRESSFAPHCPPSIGESCITVRTRSESSSLCAVQAARPAWPEIHTPNIARASRWFRKGPQSQTKTSCLVHIVHNQIFVPPSCSIWYMLHGLPNVFARYVG